MSLNINELIQKRGGENYTLHQEHINPQFAKVLRTIGFDKVYVKGEGAYLYDQDNNQVMDFLSGYGVFNVGRNHPYIKQTLKDFLDHPHPNLVQMEAPLLSGLLAEALKKRIPEALDTVYFTNSGTEGVETAIKYAHCATKKPRIIYCDHAFHGLTNGSLSLNGCHHFKDGFQPLLTECTQIAINDIAALERELQQGDVAAFCLELIQGKGCFVTDNEFVKQARELCNRYGALLIFDEVQTGFGRTGKLFAMEHSRVIPDILILSKALSGGYIPVGAVITKRDIYQKVFSRMDRCVVHSSTFGQNAMAMVAGLATLEVMDNEQLINNAQKMGDLLQNGLQQIKDKYEMVTDVRGRGLMVAIEFGRPKSLKLKVAWDMAEKMNPGIFTQAIVIPLLTDHGILTQVAGHGMNTIKLIPPLTINEQDIERFLKAFEVVVERCHRFPGPAWEVMSRLAKFTFKKK